MPDAYPKMPKPDGQIEFDGVSFPVWVVAHGGKAVKVSTVQLQHCLFVSGDPGEDYVSDRAREIDEDIAFFVDHDESVDTVLDAVFDAKTDPPKWAVSGHCVYNGDDMGSLVAECASFTIARIIMEQANKDPEFRRRIRDAK